VAPRILLVDNYDSFVYNLVQELGELGAEPVVHRNDAIDVEGIRSLNPDAIRHLSGSRATGRVGNQRCSCRRARGRVPDPRGVPRTSVHRAGLRGRIVRAPVLMHGKTSAVSHDGQGVFRGLPDPFVATRYHSLVVDPSSVPEVLEVTATAPDGTIMGLRHRELPVEGVQFHPESVLTSSGPKLLQNFLDLAVSVRS